MSEEIRFNWIAFYMEFANKLVPFNNNRPLLVSKIKTIFEHVGLNLPKLEKGGNVYDVDPFTVFGFLLMELCVAIAEGRKWLNFQCQQGRVLYVNLEIDPASAVTRFFKIYEALGVPTDNMGNILLWNLRGHAVPLDQLVPKMVRRVRDQKLQAIIIDPIYKVITGDENNASEMGAFCNQFDKICTETGCSVIYCHHHSKGSQGMKRAMDRASGSGVFARDPDAQLDMIELELTDDIKNNVRDGNATAWRLESSLREFPNITPINFWFEYPIHRVDVGGILGGMPAQGTPKAGKLNNPKSKSSDEAADEFRTAYDALNMDGKVTVKEFGDGTFSREMVTASLDYSKAHACAMLHQFTLIRVLDCRKDEEKGVFVYQLKVNPEEHPECFVKAA